MELELLSFPWDSLILSMFFKVWLCPLCLGDVTYELCGVDFTGSPGCLKPGAAGSLVLMALGGKELVALHT